MNPHNFSRKLERNLEDYGIKATSKKALSYLLKPIYEHEIYRVYCIELENHDVRKIDRDDLEFKTINWNDYKEIKQIESMEEWLYGEIETKLKGKGLCLVAMDKERVAGFNIVGFGEVYLPLIKLTKSLKKGEAWSEQITVHKKYRKRNLASDIRYSIMSELKKMGIKKFYGAALIDNKPSLGLARKVGFKEITDIHYFKFILFKIWRYHNIKS